MSKRKQHRTKSVEKSYSIKSCDQQGCKFRGKEAQQGICHTTDGDLISWDKLEAHEKEIVAELTDMQLREGKGYVRALEAHYISAMMNWQGALDETVRLRRDIAVLKNRGDR
jgi:hypothetical protein